MLSFVTPLPSCRSAATGWRTFWAVREYISLRLPLLRTLHGLRQASHFQVGPTSARQSVSSVNPFDSVEKQHLVWEYKTMKYTEVTSWSGDFHHFLITFLFIARRFLVVFRQSHLLFRNIGTGNDQNYKNPQPQETSDVRDRFWVKMRPKLWIPVGNIQNIC